MLLPADDVVADRIDSHARIAVVEATRAIPADMMALDIGPRTIGLYSQAISQASTIVWNGPMGVFEVDPFAEGTVGIALAVARNSGATSIVGGGDSVAA